MNSAQVEASYKEQWKKNNWKQLQQQDKKKTKQNIKRICYVFNKRKL